MVYLLKIVIFHGKLLENQMVHVSNWGPTKLSTPIILVAKQPYPIVPNLLSTATGVEYERGHYSSPHEDRTNFQAVLDDIQYTFPRFPVASFVGVSIFLFSTIDFLKK